MNVQEMISRLRERPDSGKMGMIASHLGIVRETSLRGEHVKYIEVTYSAGKLEEIIADISSLPGVFGVLVETASGRLSVGDPVLAVVVGGDVRERVFPALVKAVDRIKTEACRKRESLR